MQVPGSPSSASRNCRGATADRIRNPNGTACGAPQGSWVIASAFEVNRSHLMQRDQHPVWRLSVLLWVQLAWQYDGGACAIAGVPSPTENKLPMARKVAMLSAAVSRVAQNEPIVPIDEGCNPVPRRRACKQPNPSQLRQVHRRTQAPSCRPSWLCFSVPLSSA
jgi:hypothetical protein